MPLAVVLLQLDPGWLKVSKYKLCKDPHNAVTTAILISVLRREAAAIKQGARLQDNWSLPTSENE